MCPPATPQLHDRFSPISQDARRTAFLPRSFQEAEISRGIPTSSATAYLPIHLLTRLPYHAALSACTAEASISSPGSHSISNSFPRRESNSYRYFHRPSLSPTIPNE